MILKIISLIFSLLWYTVLIVLGLGASFFVYLSVFLKFSNDFPNKRRKCTSTRKLTGQTALVTGEISVHFLEVRIRFCFQLNKF